MFQNCCVPPQVEHYEQSFHVDVDSCNLLIPLFDVLYQTFLYGFNYITDENLRSLDLKTFTG